MKKNKKAKMLALAGGFAAVALIAGTFAWFTSKDSKTNHFEGEIATGKDIEIVETFEPPTDWKPGGEVNKDVAVANIGKYDVLIRISLEEKLKLLKDSEAKEVTGTELDNKTKSEVYVLPGSAAPQGYAASVFSGTVPTKQVQGSGTDSYGGTYTLKVFELVGTDAAGKTTYTYRYYFENGTTGEKYYVNGINNITRNDNGQISVVGTPVLMYIDLEYETPGRESNWTSPVYNPTFTPLTPATNVTAPSQIDPFITITFNNYTTNVADTNKWYYNTSDGFFYYLGVLKPGENTAQIIDAVTLSGQADNKYSKLSYDLIVKAEGISAYKAAVDTWVTNNSNLSTALKGLVPEK